MTALDPRALDLPWYVKVCGLDELFILTASGKVVAQVLLREPDRDQVAGLLMAGPMLSGLAGEVEQLVAAARFALDEWFLPHYGRNDVGMAALVRDKLQAALRPFPAGGAGAPRRDAPVAMSDEATTRSQASADRGPSGAPAAPTVPPAGSPPATLPATASLPEPAPDDSMPGAARPALTARPCRLIRSGKWCIEHNAACGDPGKQSADGDPEGYGDPPGAIYAGSNPLRAEDSRNTGDASVRSASLDGAGSGARVSSAGGGSNPVEFARSSEVEIPDEETVEETVRRLRLEDFIRRESW